MYRYYSTYPIGPNRFPLFANKIISFEERVEVPEIGPIWGYLEYKQALSAEVVERHKLVPAKMQTFTVKVTSIHTLEIEAESGEDATDRACSIAWEYDADEINAEVICDGRDGKAIALDLGLSEKLKEVMRHDEKSRYQLLSRLRSDCDYFLGNGHRCKQHLWAHEVDEHIDYMKALWLSFPADKRPEWLSFEEIVVYEKRMLEEKE